ncbi:MAG TPA: GYD domain-containing protein [Candidatus Bathyarchaeia archaeon]|nr:GYD domain-containing protein [Candidatus Bathyarchaeia archaeon]
MPTYLYELSYTAESIAAQMKNPQDRLETAARPALAAVGGKLLGGGFSFGDHDVVILYEAPDDESAAAVAMAVAAGGSVRAAKTTKLLSGAQWVAALRKATAVGGQYKPAR